jgi:hypothetical protein
MVAGRTLNFQIGNNILFDLFFPFPPNVRTKDTDKHTWVNADGEKQYKSDEENHRNGVGAPRHNRWFVCHIVITDVKERGESSPKGRELSWVTRENTVGEDWKGDEEGTKGGE